MTPHQLSIARENASLWPVTFNNPESRYEFSHASNKYLTRPGWACRRFIER